MKFIENAKQAVQVDTPLCRITHTVHMLYIGELSVTTDEQTERQRVVHLASSDINHHQLLLDLSQWWSEEDDDDDHPTASAAPPSCDEF